MDDKCVEESVRRWEHQALQPKSFRLRIKGEEVNVNFEPWFPVNSRPQFFVGVHHFEFHGRVISETGYRSEFIYDSQEFALYPIALYLAREFAENTKFPVRQASLF